MARYVAEGAAVTLVTCTRGEQGEIVPEDLRHLGTGKPLADARVEELAAAMAVLGVTDHRFLGPYEDSGMIGTPENERATAFWNADLDEATAHLVKVIHEVRPQVVLTYDENGGYGHPDHIQAHRIAVAGVAAAGDPEQYPEAGEPWEGAKLYYTALARSVMQRAIDYFRANPHLTPFFPPEVTSAADIPFTVPDELVTAQIDGRDYFDHKMAAMRAHKTQIEIDGPFFALADGIGQRAW